MKRSAANTSSHESAQVDLTEPNLKQNDRSCRSMRGNLKLLECNVLFTVFECDLISKADVVWGSSGKRKRSQNHVFNSFGKVKSINSLIITQIKTIMNGNKYEL